MSEKKGKQGFGSMDREVVREIGRLGGYAAQAKGTAHKWTSEEARAAGSKGGKATRAKRAKVAE